MTDATFAVTRFENRNGVTSWRVSGLLAGVRIRKNFKSKSEAAAEKAALELRALNATAGFRPATTTLSDEVREAESAFRRLVGHAHTLSFYLDYALTHFRAPERASRRQCVTLALIVQSSCRQRDSKGAAL